MELPSLIENTTWMSANFTSRPGPNDTEGSKDWRSYMLTSHLVNILLLFCIVSVLLCVTKRGTNLKAWNLSTSKGKLFIAFVVTVLCTIPRLTLDVICYEIRNTIIRLDICEEIFDLLNACGLLAMMATYFFLWLRQWITYKHDAIRMITPKWIYTLSWIAFAIFIFTSLLFFCVYVVPSSYESNEMSCVCKKTSEVSAEYRWLVIAKKYIVGGLLFLMQILFQLLFTYPMIRIRSKLPTASSHTKQNGVVAETIRRSFVSVTIAALSNLAGLGLLANIPWRTPLFVTNVVYNTFIFINLCCLVHMFRYPLDMILSCCKKQAEEYDVTITEKEGELAIIKSRNMSTNL